MLYLFFRIFQALFDLYAFSSFDLDAQHFDVLTRGIEGLMTTTFDIMYILTNDLPVLGMEDILP
jgi:hypothetical protein